MIREYERTLSEKDKRILSKEIDETASYFPKTRKSILIKITFLLVFGLIIYNYHKLWILITLSLVSLIIIMMMISEIKDLISIPKFLKEKFLAIETGVVRVKEINIDRYIKIKSYNDEGDHFIIEYKNQLMMVGGQEFDGVRKLNNRIEYIEILDSSKKRWYHNRVDKFGKIIEPHYVFRNKLSQELFNSDIWSKLTDQEPFDGKLEELDLYIELDKKK